MIFLISIFLIKKIIACEFSFTLNQDQKEERYQIKLTEFTAFGIWTKYYAFFQNITIEKDITYYQWDPYYEYEILRGYNVAGETILYYNFIKEQDSKQPNHIFQFYGDDFFEEYQSNNFIDESYEGVWIFTYIAFDKNEKRIDIIIVNTKTNKFIKQQYVGDGTLSYQIETIVQKVDFPGYVSFTQSQSSQVKFTEGEELLIHLRTCDLDNSCYSNQISTLISGILSTFEQPFQFTMQNNYWIDGWFQFTPLISKKTYNNLLLQIVQYDKEVFKYNGIIPLKIILNYDSINLQNNGIIVETSSYTKPVWDDSILNPIKEQIFHESFMELVQGWVYFRFLQYDQIDHNAEFYLSFSDSNFVIRKMGQLNLFKSGKFYIYLGQSQLNPNAFVGQLANINIQSCLTNYPYGKRTCHITCFTCNGPTEYNCLSCVDESQTNRILNPLTSSCNCKAGFISEDGQIQCVEIQKLMKQSTFQQLQIQQSVFQPCRDGQFQYTIVSSIKCYDCPQQSSQGILCADCLENLLTWQKDMKCSYDYYQENNNQNNTFIKQQRPQQKIDYYYIQDEILICQGCKLYEGGNQIVQHKTILYGSCQQGYYYNNSYCQPCQLKNCLQCNDITGQCSQCETGFVLQNQICYSCPNYCLSCLFANKIVCTSCLQGFTLGNGLCLECSANCLICQYDANLNRTKCLVCKNDGYYLPFDGIDCVKNTIENCLIQYQLKLVQYTSSINPECSDIYYITTLGFSYGCNKRHDDPIQLFNLCGLCQPQHMNFKTNCTYNGTLHSDEQAIIKYTCDLEICLGRETYLQYNEEKDIDEEIIFEQEGEMIYLISSQYNQIVRTNCQIDQCVQCLQVQNILKCLQCSQGYYANVLNGQCIQCPIPLNCFNCLQQNKNDKDAWKWKIRPNFIYEYQSDLVSSLNQKDYEIICLTCLDGYMLLDDQCILNCPKNCQKCSIIGGQNVCTFCGSNTYDKLLTIQNNQCSNCPNNCEFCQPRTDVQSINGLFNPDDGSKYFYSYICLRPSLDSKIFYHQFLQQYVQCQNGNFCMSQLYLNLKAHCDQQSYDKERSKYSNIKDFYYENVLVSNIFAYSTSHFSDIETPQFIEYLNVNQVTSLIYDLILMSSSDICQITDFIATKIPRNVFSILKNKLILNANNLTLISQGAQILNFSEVEIQQGKFYQGFSIKIQHPNQLTVKFRDIQYTSTQNTKFEIILINPLSIEISDFSIQAISNLQTSQNNIISYDYTNTSTATNLSIKMENLQLIKSSFYDIDFLILSADSRILNLLVHISNSFIEASFYNCSFIKESQITNYGSIQLNNVTFIVQVQQSYFINLNGQLNLQSSFKLSGNFINSNFIRTNYLNIADSEIYNTFLFNTTLFDNQISKQGNEQLIHRINNVKFSNTQFDISSNFITIIDKNKQGQLIVENIQIIACSFISNQQTKTTQRLIIIEGLNFQLLNSHFQKSILGLTDISIKQSKFVLFNNVTVLGKNIQGLQKKLDCYRVLVDISLQNGFIQMENIQSIQILNSQFSYLMVQNYPIIGVSLFDDSIQFTIQVTNTSFRHNLILKTEALSQNSLFQLLSTKPGNFIAKNVSFIENILNEYLQTQFSNSATTFLIEAEQFNITLNDITLNKNQIFNSSNSNLYIKANQIIMENSTFTKSNKYDDFILGFVIWGVDSTSYYFFQENLQEIFPIISVGANAKFVVDDLLIQFCQISDSIAYQGSGFHLTLQNSLSISNTNFTNLRNKLDKDESQGGSIFINLIAQNATLKINNCNFENSSSLYDGGAIYINSRYTTSNITLSQIIVKNCFSFKGTFISAYLNKYSSIKIENINVRNNIQGFNDYLSQFVDLYDNQVEQFQLNSAIFYVQYGSLYISNCIVSDIQLSSVLYSYSATYLYINALVLQNIQFGSLGLIQMIPTSNAITITFIQNVKILHCHNVQPQKNFCKNDNISFNNTFQCQNNDNKPKQLIAYPQNLKAKFDCLYNRLLDFTSSSSIIYVDMMQISDFFYISDLNMINNNCSLCTNGMIAIKNVDINIPELNNIILRKIQFQNNHCGFGCLSISQQSIINFPTRRLLQNILYQSRFTIPFTVLIEQSEFLNNSAQHGIIVVSNLSLSVIDDKFIKNTGFALSGGILYLGGQNQTFQIMTSEISDSIGNKGGALYLGNKTISSTELLQVLLSSNQATSFGQDFVGTPQGLTISVDGGKTLFQTKQISKAPIIIQEITIKPYKILGNNTLQQFLTLPSGYIIKNYQYYDENSKSFIPYNLSLRLVALNSLKQQIFNLSNSQCTILKRKINIHINDSTPFDDQGLSISKIQFNNTSQDYNLDDLMINFDPYLSHDYVMQIQFNCSSVQIPIVNNSPPYNIIDYSNNYLLRMNVRTFKCQRGESYNSVLGTCNLCDSTQSYYSVVIKASKCSVQDEITMKSVNSTHIELRENYWRPYDDNNIVTYCYNFPVNCNGGWSPGDDSCAQGHIGALCEQCDLYNIRGSGQYATSGQFQCGSCSNLSLNTIQIFLIIIWTLISIFLSVKGTVENVDEFVIRMKAIKIGFASVHFEKVQIAVLVKILTNYLQIISSIGTFQLKLPSGLKSMFTYSGNPIKSAMYSLDCFLVELSDIQILYFRNIWFIFMPIYYSTIIFIIYFLLVKLKYMQFKITVLSTTLIFIFIYVQPDIIGSFISLLSYRKISHVFWVQGNVSYLYSTPIHTRWLLLFVIPILILFGFLIPLILYIKMSKYKNNLNDTLVLRLYGYLYNEYSKATYYWEIIKICQKELIIIFLTFYEDIIIIKGTIVFIIIFCYDMFSKRFKPYKRLDLNKLDSQSSFVCGFSIVLGMAIYFADQNDNQEILWPFFFILGIFNLYFIIGLIKLLIIGYLDKLADQLDQIRDYINKKYPNIISNYPQLRQYLENSKIKSTRIRQRYLKLKEYLMKKVHQNLEEKKNKKLEMANDQDIIQNVLESDTENQQQINQANQSIQCSISNKKSRNQSIIQSDENIQDRIIVCLDLEKLNSKQLEKPEEEDGQEILILNNNSYKSIPIEVENVQEFNSPIEDDLQNNNDDEQQENSSFQK